MKPSTVFALVILAILASTFLVLPGYPLLVKLFPYIVGIPLAALLVIEVLLELFEKPKPVDTPASEAGASVHLNLTGALWLLAILPLLYLLGFVAGSLVYSFLYMKLHEQRWHVAAGLSVLSAAVIYAGFIAILKIPLYEGLVFLWLFKGDG